MSRAIFGIISIALLITVLVSSPSIKKAGAENKAADQDKIEKIKKKSLEHVKAQMTMERALPGAEDLVVQSIQFDDLEMSHTLVQQTVSGVPVWGGEAIVHLNSDESVFGVTDSIKEVVTINTEPNLTNEDAIKLAKKMFHGSKALSEEPTADLWVFPAEDRTHLAYRVRMRREDKSKQTAMPVIFVDAQTGEEIFQYDNLQTATGVSRYSGTVTVSTSSDGSTYYLEDLTRRIGTFDSRNGTSSTIYRFTDADDLWNSPSQQNAIDAHYGAAMTYDYFKNVHGRNGIDGIGGPGTQVSAANATINLMASRVNYGSNYNNAFWNGSAVVYGNGDGTTLGSLTTVDIGGHEMTHGIIERTARLIYSGESGALNESFADVFGAMVERHAYGDSPNIWKHGEKAFTPATPGDAIRYLDNPHSASNSGFTVDDDPDHYSERYTGTGDNSGVHINAGIGNRAFYLLAVGGTHHKGGSMVGIGADAAARIWYKALTSYMTSSTNFAGARTATLNAAAAIYGSSSRNYEAVNQAWCLVGIGTSCGGTSPTGGELLNNGGFEASASPWVGSGSGYFHIANGAQPHGGTGYIYFGVNNNTSGQSYQQVSIPTTATGTLSFWLSVSSNETTTTTQYDKLFVEVRNPLGSLLTTAATYSNLNKGTGYSQTSLSLAAFKGQTVRIQFRSTTDATQATTFRLDDVSLK